ncbi:hypothetical protein PC129_g21580 [Phytophthora cactorum]|uniref:Uncharacterized protein n=1 Tax=Phytophthora cactorum TaxID=29920 RepID=A0A8T0Y394_9STRA|nr:hypothetical protein PC111_g21525 [Phytophthora cactorum]KAG2797118.1 hypothetical protein PC112_g21919 [Phytophthora cactorum]KAG2825973.1 hypothetical protein PC113_g21845 [Phytophthora cactorum]KAG2875465.1 hypothetical protein PC114_g24703 [Phytophthora cactorum]KAG2882269.1 hypothetical protein PC115_g21985 [Phytophthora cactorum]
MALVNAYIIFRHHREHIKKRKNSNYVFLARLHKELIEEREDSFTQTRGRSGQHDEAERPVAVHDDHALTQTKDIRLNNQVQRLRHRQCKVCSVYKPRGRREAGRLATTGLRAHGTAAD